jgi:hypothetical protein
MLGLNRSEQRLLSCALPGETNEQLAGMLGTTLSGVKKMWVSIYRRVENCLPELIPDPLRLDIPGVGEEGKSGATCWLICANIPRNYARFRECGPALRRIADQALQPWWGA